MTPPIQTQSGQNPEENTRPLLGRFKWVRGFIYALAIGSLIMLAGNIIVFFTDFTGYNPDIDFSTSDKFYLVGALISMPAYIGSVIAFSMFTYRAMKNLHFWGSRSAEMSAGWAVGWYFVPIGNLWKPYQGMDQIWDGTNEVVGRKFIANTKIGFWWAFWIATNFASGISEAMAEMDGPWNVVLKQAAVFDVIAICSILLAIFFITPTLKLIAERQDGKIKSQSFD